jgi:hypothetical protein
MARMTPRSLRPNQATIDPASEIEQLMTDLQVLINAGLIVEIRELGQPLRYAARRSAGDPMSDPADVKDYSEPDLPEPCPACGAREGFDGGGRCNRCHIAWPPEM